MENYIELLDLEIKAEIKEYEEGNFQNDPLKKTLLEIFYQINNNCKNLLESKHEKIELSLCISEIIRPSHSYAIFLDVVKMFEKNGFETYKREDGKITFYATRESIITSLIDRNDPFEINEARLTSALDKFKRGESFCKNLIKDQYYKIHNKNCPE